MLLPIVKYGHPALRQKGARLNSAPPEIQRLIDDMFETMYDAHGIGLAAQQVAHPIQLTVIDLRDVTDRPSTLVRDGQSTDPAELMPLVLINPQVKPVADPVAGAEGCLSFPEIYFDVVRPESVDVTALDRHGKPMAFRCGGLLARAIQHEADHLNGVLFIDRIAAEKKAELRHELEELRLATVASLKPAKR